MGKDLVLALTDGSRRRDGTHDGQMKYWEPWWWTGATS